MAKGYYLSRADGIFATGRGPYSFDKLCQTLPRKGQGKNKKFFIPEFETTQDFRAKNIPCQEQLNSDVLDQLVNNVDFTTDQQIENLNKEYKKAQIAKTQADTKLVGERLQQRKRQLFNDWSESFFQSFANHFGRLKNLIIELRLNQQQVNKFNQCLDKCLQNMSLDLNKLYTEFKEEEKEDE